MLSDLHGKAQRHAARSWELRATTRLSRLLASCHDEARALLVEI